MANKLTVNPMPRKKEGGSEIPEKALRTPFRISPYFSRVFSDTIGKILLAVTIVAVVNLGVTIFLTVEVFCLRSQLKAADARTAALTEEMASLRLGWVDSSFTDVQPIGLGFSLVDLKTQPVDGGVKVSGSIINGTTLDYYETHFKVFFDENRSAEFSIPTLLAGYAAPFEVIVPPPTERFVPEKIKILFAGSQVSYF